MATEALLRDDDDEREDAVDKIVRHADALSTRLQAIRRQLYPPQAAKTLRTFTPNEVAALIGIPAPTLRKMTLEGKGPEPARLENNHRAYTLAQMNELRRYLAEHRPSEATIFVPRRQMHEHLQVVALANFKGGSAKTTTSVHFAHYLALKGFRVLAIDLDPQASMSAMFGHQPEFDVGDNETIYGAMRYDDDRRSIRDVIRPTYFDGLDLIPGGAEVMEFEHDTPKVLATKGGADTIFFDRLREAIGEVGDDYDIVVLDTPPSLGFLTLSALYAATGLVVTVHPAMLDVASMSQFLLMMGDLASTLREAGARMENDFVRYLLTRHDPNDQAQVKIASMLRAQFPDDVLMPTSIQSAAVEIAGLSKRTLYEIEAGEVQRSTLKRARESVDAVNEGLLDLILDAWGRKRGST